MTDRGAALLEQTAALVAIPSVSRHEGALATYVEAELEAIDGLAVSRVGNNVVARTHPDRPARLLLAGHLDTVPPAANERPERDGALLRGIGAADMKGGLAVMLGIAATAPTRGIPLTFVFYAREEVSREESGLLEIEALAPALLDAEAAVVLEPTGAVVEAGCQGSLRVEAVLSGERAHSARPWAGTNAIHRAGELLALVRSGGDREVVLDGCAYRESLQAVGITGGGVGNVIPDRASVTINYRFAPDRSPGEALDALRAHLAPVLGAREGDELVVLDLAPPASPSLNDQALAALVELSGAPPRGKFAWTDVAFFAERGVPAANYGPGDPLLAHHRDEFVTIDDLAAVDATLDRLIATLAE